MRQIRLTLALAAPVVLLYSRPVGDPGTWTRLCDYTGRNIDEPALARGVDGALHVIRLRRSEGKVDLVHVSVDRAGGLLDPGTAVVSGWNALHNPLLLVDASGDLRAIVGGLRGSGPRDPFDGSLYAATGPSDGSAWELHEEALVASKNTGNPGGVLLPDGTPVLAWAAGTNTAVQLGAAPDASLRLQTACCGYEPGVARDAGSGEVAVAWYSNANREHGILVRTVLPSPGDAQVVPGSANTDRTASRSATQRIAIVGRPGAPGIYLAYCAGYPTCETVNLWRVGGAEPSVVSRGSGAAYVAAAPGPEGRLWVFWGRGGRIFATRSNRAATRMGPVAEIAPPGGTQQIWKLDGDGAVWRLDLVATVQTGEGIAPWHTQVLPGLSVSASPSKVTAGAATEVTLTVTDAGDPVEDAEISVAGETLRTGANGRITYSIPADAAPGRVAVRAAKSDYRPAAASVTIEPKPPEKQDR